MAKSTTAYVCDSCGDSFSRWSGKCLSCGEWNTLKEFKTAQTHASGAKRSVAKLDPQKISSHIQSSKQRRKVGIGPLDEVLGGGLVSGSVVLLAGEPGIGKSTILMQVSGLLSKQAKVLYISAEESAEQVSLRAKRLGYDNSEVLLASETSSDVIAETIAAGTYDVVIVDSIQTISVDRLQSSSGTASQITQSAQLLTRVAKRTDTTLIIVGHVTKEGTIAGPKLLEHLVDVVLNIEGDRFGGFKVLRSVKNRFGSTNEIGLFEMQNEGLIPIENPSAALLNERQAGDGSVVLATMEGTRPLLVEVQALVNTTNFGYPKRTASGIDLNRLNLLVAVLNKRTKLDLSNKDVFVNIVGGLKISEPAADLAICMAIASASKGLQLKNDAVVFGEVGLSGEVRRVSSIERRVSEAKKLGFKRVLGPKTGKKITSYHELSDLRQALNENLT
ncbi:TPA: DNA repair protein RadA [Candidatus Saccharibacteria bacterium]|nr:DNA repair protein RadA [Candidatus Saccharibacteria bacterium]HIO87431.1 DNA repair protein RadA [Candidatus Saccharibacteria bacterium]